MRAFLTSWEKSRVKSIYRWGLMHRSKNPLFDHLVGHGQQTRRHFKAEPLHRDGAEREGAALSRWFFTPWALSFNFPDFPLISPR
jgi:hypothetical protein